VASNFAKEIAAVDSFSADAGKTLYGPPPEFGATKFHRNGAYEWDATWPIADGLGIVTSGQLRFVVRPGSPLGPSISLVFNRQMVARLDIEATEICENNPLWAAAFGLPPRVCGPHYHAWEHNKGHIADVKEWELPCREPLPRRSGGLIRRFRGWPPGSTWY
jgi:hypothetical protein